MSGRGRGRGRGRGCKLYLRVNHVPNYVLVCGNIFLFIQFSMFLFVILIQKICRGHWFGVAGVGTAPPN
jgi:hypothetical protein